jgi:acetyltransferase-like isoleucine patch superfamily enzyme
MITDSDAHPLHPSDRRFNLSSGVSKPIIIEDDVFVGARAIILKGVHIGPGSVVGPVRLLLVMFLQWLWLRVIRRWL